MSADGEDLDALADDLVKIPSRMVPKIRPIISKGALNIKKQLTAEARRSPYFKRVGASIGYQIKHHEFAGDAVLEAEIGPEAERDSAAGLLGAYFGWSNGGGGTLPDPADALLAEAPNFLEHVFKATEDLL